MSRRANAVVPSFANRVRTTLWRNGSDYRRHAPAWAEWERMAEVYEAAWMVGREVDHIVPLRGYAWVDGEKVQTVSGLHVRANLRIVDRAKNMQKVNFWPLLRFTCEVCGFRGYALRERVCMRTAACRRLYAAAFFELYPEKVRAKARNSKRAQYARDPEKYREISRANRAAAMAEDADAVRSKERERYKARAAARPVKPVPSDEELALRAAAQRERRAASDKAYRARNAEAVAARKLAYAESNRERLRENARLYRQAHPEVMRRYREANREKFRLAQRAYVARRKAAVAADS